MKFLDLQVFYRTVASYIRDGYDLTSLHSTNGGAVKIVVLSLDKYFMKPETVELFWYNSQDRYDQDNNHFPAAE